METTANVNVSLSEKYIRKPLIVDAVQITAENFSAVARWCTGEIKNQNETPVDATAEIDPATQYISVRVQNPKNLSQTKGKIGDWILYAERGGYKVYTPRAFVLNFDLLADSQISE